MIRKKPSLEQMKAQVVEIQGKLNMFYENYAPRYQEIIDKYEAELKVLQRKISTIENMPVKEEVQETSIIRDSVTDKKLDQLEYLYINHITAIAGDREPSLNGQVKMKELIKEIEFRKNLANKAGKTIELPKWYEQASQLVNDNKEAIEDAEKHPFGKMEGFNYEEEESTPEQVEEVEE